MSSKLIDNKEIKVNFEEGDNKDYINISIDFKKSIFIDKNIFNNDDEIKEYIQELVSKINISIDEYCDEIYEDLNGE